MIEKPAMVDSSRLWAAYQTSRSDLVAQRAPDGHWSGWLSSSPLATATAISALVLAEQHGRRQDDELSLEQVYQSDLSQLIIGGLHWLANHQNVDGGWGDTDKSLSNVGTTMLVNAAFHLTGVPARYAGMLERAQLYIRGQGGVGALRRRYGKDRTFATSILASCALAGIVPWHDVPVLPFELASLPPSLHRYFRLPVVGYTIPILIAIGLAKYHCIKPLNPVTRLVRSTAIEPGLQLLAKMQPASGGFLEAVPLTSFVVMGLASTGRGRHPVVRRSVEFLLGAVRGDGSWPMDTDLSVWSTAQSLLALDAVPSGPGDESADQQAHENVAIDWLVACQRQHPDPRTGTEPGGWAWTDAAGAVADVDDTAAALLVLANRRDDARSTRGRTIDQAAMSGITWLLKRQNPDGGWPALCRGRGRSPFDCSGSDLTAHAMRALAAWQQRWSAQQPSSSHGADKGHLDRLGKAIAEALGRGWEYLVRDQRDDGSWLPLWFDREHDPREENPVYGTARVLMTLRDLWRLDTPSARKAIDWLCRHQAAAGGWTSRAATTDGYRDDCCNVEETALATEVLMAADADGPARAASERGLDWLVHAVETGRHRESSTPIGFYFAKFGSCEALCPLIFSVSALGHAAARHDCHPAGTCMPTRTTA